MRNSVLALFLIIAGTFAADAQTRSFPLAAGDRVRLRHEAGIATVTGSDSRTLEVAIDGGDMAAERMSIRRIGARTVEVSTHGSATIRLPRDTRFESVSGERAAVNIRGLRAVSVRAPSGNVTVEQIETNVDAQLGSANLKLREIGGNVVASSGSGNITATDVRGLVQVTTGNGNVVLRNVGSGVNVVSVNGKTDVACAAGAIDVRDTSGRVTVRDVSGDVDIFTALGQAFYDGALQRSRFYRLRTLDGAVTLTYAIDGAGFTGTLASDTGHIESDLPQAHAKRGRAEVRVGDERARVVLDAVGGRVALRKRAAAPNACGGGR